MSLKISAERNFTVIKDVKYADQSLDPEKTRSSDGNYMRVSVMNPTQITFTKGFREYFDTDVKNGDPEDTIESILKWPTIRSFIKKGLLTVATSVYDEDSEEEVVVKKTKKPLSFTPEEK